MTAAAATARVRITMIRKIRISEATAAINTNTSQACNQYRYSTYKAPNPTLSTNNSLYLIRIGARFRF